MSTTIHSPTTWLVPGTGETIAHGRLLAAMAGKSAVLLGETHDRYDIHRWQLHVLSGLLAHRTDIVVGFEMFPRRVQPALDKWVAGALGDDAFLEEADWKTVWGFPADLYMPIFHFCRQHGVPMKALNCRRALVTEVGKLGWDEIPIHDRDGVTPAKPATAAYRQYLFDITGGVRPGREATQPQDPAFDRFVRAQQTWDRAFACNIAEAIGESDGALVVGIIGRGHLEYGHGTPYQLADLGVRDVAVLLPSDTETVRLEQEPIADGLFRLPPIERSVAKRG
ncbi:ChaN family lipoprotein [Ensifer sp. NPDC090286]|uniref:ChaN family lipoprotein n=1 Tax=Ensifer sp. NPDC090286 TaxID=3363991 RepID=UPI00383AB711